MQAFKLRGEFNLFKKITSLLCLALGLPGLGFSEPLESLVEKTPTIQNIQVNGLVHLKPETVLYDLPVKVGQNLKPGQSTEIIQKLYKTGLYRDIKLHWRSAGTLVIDVQEKPIVKNFQIKGTKDQDKLFKMLKKEAQLAQGWAYDPALLVKAKSLLQHHYMNQGRYAVKVDSSVKPLNDYQVDLVLDVYEGEEAKIKKINFIGNASFSEFELLKSFVLNSESGIFSWFNNRSKYKKEKLEMDLENLKSFYMDRGYVNVQIINAQVSITPDKKDVYITIPIEEGEKYAFGTIDIGGTLPISKTALIEKLSSIRSGEIFSRRKLMDVKQDLERVLGDAGFSASEVRPIPNIDPLKKLVHVIYQVSPAERVYVRRIEIQGNDITQDRVVRRELPQMEGTWVSTELLEEGKRNLMHRGFAKEVEIKLLPVGGQDHLVDVLYKIQEEKVREISAGVSYSNEEKFAYRFGFAQKNFLGTGKDTDLVLENSKISNTYSINYTDPYYTKDGIGFGGGVYFKKLELGHAINFSDYATDTYGGSGYFVFPFSKKIYGSAGFGYDKTHLKSAGIMTQEFTQFVTKHGRKYQDYFMTLGWGFDDLDQLMFPTQGMSHGVNLKLAAPVSTLKYYTLKYEGNYYQPLQTEGFILNLKGLVGYGGGYGSTRSLPFFKNFYAGGIGSVRGYEEGSLGPKDSRGYPFGGNLMTTATMALILPNPIKPDAKSLRTACFVDLGQVYDTKDRYGLIHGEKFKRNPSGFRYSAGVSFQWHTPLGFPLVLSLAKPLNVKGGDRKQTFAFTLGAGL